MFVYQIGSSVNVMMEGGEPAPLDKEADVVFGLDNFVYPGEEESFNPFGKAKTIVERMEGAVKQSADYVANVTMTFDTDGGSEVAAIEGDPGDEYEKPADPTKEDFVFDGWNPELPDVIPEEDTTYTAQWKSA